MASKAIVERLGDELLTCTICYEFYSEPKVLPCLHSFCRDCLGRHFEIHKLRNGDRLCCPTCRELFPLPIGGVSGFRNDAVVDRCRELLLSLPIELEDEIDQEDYDIRPLLASGFDFQAQEIEKETLYVKVTHMQNALARLRSKLLHMYTVETYIKRSITCEVSGMPVQTQQQANSEISNARKDAGSVYDQSFGPAIAQLVTEQDKLYQRIVDIKAVHDVSEEVLGSASSQQFDGAFKSLMKQIEILGPLIERESSCDLSAGSSEKFMQELNIPPNVLKDALFATVYNDGPHSANDKGQKKKVRKDFKVKLLSQVKGRGVGPTKFDFPTCASFIHNGDIVVCDKNNLRLQIFDSNLELKDVLHQGQMKPRKACVCPHDGYLYVSDELSLCVKVFSVEGKLVRHIGDGRMQCPEGIAFNSKGHLVVSDPETCYIYIFKRNGSLISKFFYRFRGDRSIPNPYFLAINEDDQIVVTDHRNNQVRVFTNTGQPLFSIPNLVVPRGVCIDPNGNILVAESDKHRVSMYSPYGKFIQHLIEAESFGIKFPMSLDVNDKGQLLVTQCGYYEPHVISLFQIC